MSFVSRMIGTAERVPLPDVIIRAAIQRLCSRTATRLAGAGASSDAAFAGAMANRAIADHTEADARHHQVPATFFAQVLGPNRKYSSCFYKEPASTLQEAEEEALRRALAIMAMPGNAARALRLGWHSADAMWRLAGDKATDYNHYTKRAILGGVYAATLAVFADDASEGKADTHAFLDRRIDASVEASAWKAETSRATGPTVFIAQAEGLGIIRSSPGKDTNRVNARETNAYTSARWAVFTEFPPLLLLPGPADRAMKTAGPSARDDPSSHMTR
mgnify:CR=1 FL=1